MLVLGNFLFPAQVGKVKGVGLDVGACGAGFPAQVENSQGWRPAFPLVDSGRVVPEGFIFQSSWKKVKGEGLRVGAWQLPFPAQVGKVKGEGLSVGAWQLPFPAQLGKSQG